MSYNCSECGKSFGRKDHRDQHEREVHDDAVENLIDEWRDNK